MAAKKETPAQISAAEAEQIQHIVTNYRHLAEQLYHSTTQEQAEATLTELNALSEAAQIAFVKTLVKTNDQETANILTAIHTLSPNKETRKEARRALIRLEAAKIYPKWVAPVNKAPAIQTPVAHPPRFWKGFATQTREEGELQIFLIWEQGADYAEAQAISFLLDFWNDGVKDAFVETGTKRRIENSLNELRTRLAASSYTSLVSCTLAEGKRLLEEALAVNQNKNTTPTAEYKAHLPLINRLILQATELDADRGTTFITPDLQEQEVVVNFIGAWSFGDFGLAYDLLTNESPVCDQMSRTDWINLHQQWHTEAHPTRMELGFVHELAPQQQHSGLWLPSSATQTTETKDLDVGWSLELLDTPLSGTLKEMPMGTAINKETGRYWFWNRFTLTKEKGVWRIQQLLDEGAALQALSAETLQQRIDEYEKAVEKLVQPGQQSPVEPTREVIEEVAWRMAQLLHLGDALITQRPADYEVTEQAYQRAIVSGNPERAMVYIERMVQRFPEVTENRATALRSLGATLAELAYRAQSQSNNLKNRAERFLARAEELLREALTLDESAMGYSLLAELLLSRDKIEEAQREMVKARELLSAQTTEPEEGVEASVEAGLGNIAIRLENAEDALPHYQRVAELDSDYPGIWFSLGFVQRQLDQLEEAEKTYLHGLQLTPEDIRFYSELTAIYVNRENFQQAREILEQGVRTVPNSLELHALLGSLLHEMGDRRGAQKQLEIAEQMDANADIVHSLKQQMSGKTTRRRV
ncbi:MAG TPA: hypothetical protein VL461_02250 [Dictyobacter sp.]|jgi:tetratricopeptide (TPR) repeat protein|nr:hypothetical protein [Dictyobacter sp.]